MSLESRRRALMGPNGEEILYEPKTGCYYTNPLDITISGYVGNSGELASRYARCSYLTEATIRGTSVIGRSGDGNDCLSYNPLLEKVNLPRGCGTNSYIAQSCPKLSEVTLGSVGHAVTGLYYNAFRNSGTSAESKTITVYVSDSATLPLTSAPWGLTGATVIYRSATTGEVIEV